MASFVGRLQNVLASKLFAVVLISLLLSCLSILPIANVSAQTCYGGWGISGTSGIKTNYQLGETISGSVSFKINNPTDCPSCTRQILVGLIDSQDYVVNLKCIFDGIPQVCPQWTTGTGDFSWKNPNSPGSYRIIAVNDHQPSCFDAQLYLYPKITSYKNIATITVSASKTDEKSVAPTTPPLPPPTKEDTTTGSSGSGTTQDGGASKTGVSTQFIIVAIALLVLLFIFSLIGLKALKGFLRFILVLSVVSFLGYLLWMYGIPAITGWFSKNLSTIIGVLLLLGILAIAGTAVWKNWDKIRRWWFEEPWPTCRPNKPNPSREGYIYIARCPSHEDNLYKVGRSKHHPKKRIIEISTTGVPEKFILIEHWEVTDRVLAESRVHKALDEYRVNPNREFFKARPKIIIPIIGEEIKDIIVKTDREMNRSRK